MRNAYKNFNENLSRFQELDCPGILIKCLPLCDNSTTSVIIKNFIILTTSKRYQIASGVPVSGNVVRRSSYLRVATCDRVKRRRTTEFSIGKTILTLNHRRAPYSDCPDYRSNLVSTLGIDGRPHLLCTYRPLALRPSLFHFLRRQSSIRHIESITEPWLAVFTRPLWTSPITLRTLCKYKNRLCVSLFDRQDVSTSRPSPCVALYFVDGVTIVIIDIVYYFLR